jgi:hypothetical protein
MVVKVIILFIIQVVKLLMKVRARDMKENSKQNLKDYL